MNAFSESWHRVANLRIRLRRQVRVHRQSIRGELWHVLHDPLANKFFRMRAAAWNLIGRLDGSRPLDAVWREVVALDPERAPGQAEVIQLLAQLHGSNLIQSDAPPDAVQVFERQRRQARRELGTRMLSFMFARFPLVNPDPWLVKLAPLGRLIFSRAGGILWLLLVLSGLKVCIENFGALADQGQAVLAPANLGWLYLSMVGLALFHEAGHALACRRFGGEVPTLGVMLLILTPLPYVDVTSSWSFRRKRHRILVGAGGMMAELAIASMAAWVWASTGEGLLNSLAFNLLFLASVSTLLFNINPLLRFDGYYILSDALDFPNLAPRGQAQLLHGVRSQVLGLRDRPEPAQDRTERWALYGYGTASLIYRLAIGVVIILFIADQLLIVGVIVALLCTFLWLVLPVIKGARFLLDDPSLDRRRGRAFAGVGAALGVPLLLLAAVPFPHTFTAPGVVQAADHALVVAEVGGEVAAVLTAPGTPVPAGTPLLLLRNDELGEERKAAGARLTEAEVRERKALRDGSVYSGAAARHREAVVVQAALVEAQSRSLEVRARISGIWSAPEIEDRIGARVLRGEPLGELVGEGTRTFIAVIGQERAGDLFDTEAPVRGAKVRLRGDAFRTLRFEAPAVLPGDRRRLPSPALGIPGGGFLAVSQDDSSGVTTVEPFFALEVTLPEGVVARHGQTGRMLIQLPPKPLLAQGWDALRKLLQKRFSL